MFTPAKFWFPTHFFRCNVVWLGKISNMCLASNSVVCARLRRVKIYGSPGGNQLFSDVCIFILFCSSGKSLRSKANTIILWNNLCCEMQTGHLDWTQTEKATLSGMFDLVTTKLGFFHMPDACCSLVIMPNFPAKQMCDQLGSCYISQ